MIRCSFFSWWHYFFLIHIHISHCYCFAQIFSAIFASPSTTQPNTKFRSNQEQKKYENKFCHSQYCSKYRKEYIYSLKENYYYYYCYYYYYYYCYKWRSMEKGDTFFEYFLCDDCLLLLLVFFFSFF